MCSVAIVECWKPVAKKKNSLTDLSVFSCCVHICKVNNHKCVEEQSNDYSFVLLLANHVDTYLLCVCVLINCSCPTLLCTSKLFSLCWCAAVFKTVKYVHTQCVTPSTVTACNSLCKVLKNHFSKVNWDIGMAHYTNKRLHIPSLYFCLPCLTVP